MNAHTKTDAPASLLLELGTEELPPGNLQGLAQAFAGGVAKGLHAAGVSASADNYRAFATPRRLAVAVAGVAAVQPAREVVRRGPAVKSAFDGDGKPTRAAEGFAKSCGVAVDALQRIDTEKGECLVHKSVAPGKPLAEIVNDVLREVTAKLPIAKRMRWGDGDAEFVRPVHWLLALHGDEVVAAEAFGLHAGRATRGHRFHSQGESEVACADEYESRLQDAKVIADFARRRDVIREQIDALAGDAGGVAAADAELLDTVTAMVEWPRAIRGAFDARFLQLPQEVLIACMRGHQKYFHLRDATGALLPAFITVGNIECEDASRMRAGNERVLRARLSDAEFFHNADLQTSLEKHAAKLDAVLFHQKLGSVHNKVERLQKLAAGIAEPLSADAGDAKRAAQLCKADLVGDMVGEFPELQGVMGKYYARASGESAAVADAIEQHYWPRFAGDELPRDAVAQCIALADRLDSLVGLFAAGEAPGGDKDPFALRRAALGVLRIIIEKELDLDLHALLEAARDTHSIDGNDELVARVFAFVMERLTAYYQPQGFSAEELAAVHACHPRKPLDFDRRLKAVRAFRQNESEAAAALAAANKRIVNLLKKSGGNVDDAAAVQYDAKLFQHDVERELAARLDDAGGRARADFAEGNYDRGLAELAKLKAPVDSFFDEVMVMHDDADIRANRLALLRTIRGLFLGAADISCLGEK